MEYGVKCVMLAQNRVSPLWLCSLSPRCTASCLVFYKGSIGMPGVLLANLTDTFLQARVSKGVSVQGIPSIHPRTKKKTCPRRCHFVSSCIIPSVVICLTFCFPAICLLDNFLPVYWNKKHFKFQNLIFWLFFSQLGFSFVICVTFCFPAIFLLDFFWLFTLTKNISNFKI